MRFGVFVYDGVEPIDLATFGVLSMARRVAPEITIITIAPAAGIVTLSNGLRIVADHGVNDDPACDVVIVTGGPGWPEAARSKPTLNYLSAAAGRGRVASVCTGAMLLAASGVLAGHPATTKRRALAPEEPPIDVLRREYGDIDVREASLVDAGGIVTGGGVSLCIDATLYILAVTLGNEVAEETARIIEYDRARTANEVLFPPVLASAA